MGRGLNRAGRILLPARSGDFSGRPHNPPPVNHAAAVRHLKRADPQLARWIERVGPCRLAPGADGLSHFEALVRSIVYQQLSGRAAATIHGRVIARCGGTPSPESLARLSDADLRAAGLSAAKLKALRDLSARVADGRLPLNRVAGLPDDELIVAVGETRGIGVWTAQMFLMFQLGRPDVLPVADLGIRKGFARVTGMKSLPAARTLERRAERWRPHRTVASWYLWRVLEL